MPPKNPKVPGVSLSEAEANAAYSRRMTALGELLARYTDVENTEAVTLVRVSIRLPSNQSAECLVTIAALDKAGDPIVAFTAGRYADDTLLTAMSSFHNGSLKWKEDKYAK